MGSVTTLPPLSLCGSPEGEDKENAGRMDDFPFDKDLFNDALSPSEQRESLLDAVDAAVVRVNTIERAVSETLQANPS